NGETSASVSVNGKEVKLPQNGTVEKTIRTENGTTKLNVKVNRDSTASNSSSVSTNLNVTTHSTHFDHDTNHRSEHSTPQASDQSSPVAAFGLRSGSGEHPRSISINNKGGQMKKIAKSAGAAVTSLGLVVGLAGFAGATSGTIGNTGPASNNQITSNSSRTA